MSRFSPKNPYRIEVVFAEAIADLGNCFSETSESLENAKAAAERIRNTYGKPCHCTIRHNKAQYPSFDWEIVESYDLQ